MSPDWVLTLHQENNTEISSEIKISLYDEMQKKANMEDYYVDLFRVLSTHPINTLEDILVVIGVCSDIAMSPITVGPVIKSVVRDIKKADYFSTGNTLEDNYI